jgi:LPS-assembly lipoprotein
MSSSDRRHFLLGLAALPLAACGFTPAYGPGGAADALRGRVQLRDPVTQDDFHFVSHMETRIGRAQAAAYDLGYDIATSVQASGITATNVTTRYTLNGSATWSLTDRASGARIAGGTVRGFTSWSATGTTIAGLAAQEDASRRLMVMLGDQIVTRLIAASPNLPSSR